MNTDDYKLVKYRGKPVANLKQHKTISSKFLIDFRINGKRYRPLVHVVDDGSPVDMIQRAIHKRDEIIKLKSNEEASVEVSNMTLTQYFTRYITVRAKANKWSDKYFEDTKRAYKLYVEDVIGSKKVTTIKSTNITDVMDGVAHLSLRSQKLVIDLLKPLFTKALLDDGIITKTPIQSSHNVKRNPKEEKKIVVEAVDKYKLVHSTIHEIFANEPRNRALILFGFYGRRKMETLQIRWEDVNLESLAYTVRAENSKAKTSMTFELATDLAQALKELKKQSNDTGYIFESLTKPNTHQIKVDSQVMRLRAATGIESLTYHWLRNLAVSALSAQGVAPIHLSSLLGHTDINTVNKYLSLQRVASSAVTNDISQKLLNGTTK